MSDLGPIARRFDAAAQSYEAATPIQRQVALALAEEIKRAGLTPNPRVVEFGCGVGYLTEALLPALDPAHWLASDIAPAMLAALERRLTHPALTLSRLDAAVPDLEHRFDLVCSSLTLQWLPDPPDAIRRWAALVRPGGLLAFSTLLDGSFGEWRAALAQAGAGNPGPAFPNLAMLAGWLGPSARISTMTLVDRPGGALAFLKAARAAGIDGTLGRALGPGLMRRAMRRFDDAAPSITYRVALVLERR